MILVLAERNDTIIGRFPNTCRSVSLAFAINFTLIGIIFLLFMALGGCSDSHHNSLSNDSSKISTEEKVVANGIEWRVLRWGPRDGEPFLLLHGFPQDADTWQSVAAELAQKGYNVVAFDLRGSTIETLGDPTEYMYDLFISDALAIADATGLQHFNLAGFGWGCALSWMVAAKHPERVKSLIALRYPHPAAFANGILNDPAQKASWDALQEQLGAGGTAQRAKAFLENNAESLRNFLDVSGLPQPFLDNYISRLSEPGVLVGGLSWQDALELEYFYSVPEVTVPTLFIWSEGPALTKSSVDASANYVNAQYYWVVEIIGSGHFMLETSPKIVSREILNFMDVIHEGL